MKVNVKHRAPYVQKTMGNAKVEAAAGTMTRLITRGMLRLRLEIVRFSQENIFFSYIAVIKVSIVVIVFVAKR
jgi:hypothetical protein